MRTSRGRISAAMVAIATCAALAACGDGTVTFGGGDNDDDKAKVTFKGNLDDVSPVTSRDIVVFVYNLDGNVDPDTTTTLVPSTTIGPNDTCSCPRIPGNLETLEGRVAVLESGETEFTISGLDPGHFVVIFLQDKAGDNADGEINDGDPIAILDDEDCELDDVDGNLTVTLESIDLVFAEAPVNNCNDGDPPGIGRARADRITQKTTTNSDN